MENTCSTLLYSKIRSTLALLFFSFFIHLLVSAVAGDSPFAYKPVENIILACGSSDKDVSEDGRNLVGDVNSQYFSLQAQNSLSNASRSPQQPTTSSEKFYLKARFSSSPFTYIFNITPGPKFIRLYFFPTTYPHFDVSKAFFSVQANSFTLLKNFSASLTAAAADPGSQETVSKEYCVNVEEDGLNITFTPSPDYKKAYAFINGIEIVSMPSNLYYTEPQGIINRPFKFLGQVNPFSIDTSNALETIYRINVGGKHISPAEDTGMYRNWIEEGDRYLTEAKPGVKLVNNTINIRFDDHETPNYTAPVTVYQTAMSMGQNRTINENYNLTWEFPVDAGFTYFVRLHFCEFQIEITEVSRRTFMIYIANQTAETQVDIFEWSGGKGIPIYTQYAVLMAPRGDEKKQKLSIALHPAPRWMTNYSDAILNGLEIFKVDMNKNLAGPNPDWIPPASVPKTNPESARGKNKTTTIIAVVAGVASGFVVLSLLLLLIFRRSRHVKDWASSTVGTSFWIPFSASTTKSTKSRGLSLPSDLCTHFSLVEIKAATNNFDEAFIIGVGGFGNVYKGYINDASTPVAIKRLTPGSQQGALEFNTEIELLSRLRHLHLVSLIGYCNDHGEMILVYDYMSRGTLRDHLYNTDNPPLPWKQRLEICIGAARGLHYLHTGAKHVIIHRDVKTTNILLDEKWVAKVSDFGLSRFGPTTTSKTHVSTVVKGSIGYLDPEYYRLQHLTEKSDVYSFGVVLFEVLCARAPILRAVEKNQVSLAAWARQCYRSETVYEIIDPVLKGQITPECLKKFAEVAMSCLEDNGTRRPSMSDVVWGLEFALQLQETAEKQEKFKGGEEDITKGEVADEWDIESRSLFSSIGEHVLESKSVSTVTLTTSDEQSFIAGSREVSGGFFSEIMNPQGR
ncbi:receptor-like protein kinase FERONIA [Mangifera indica]|uniref:receptor-like protein kinase FERONIA n=1 Tax=Mangifera indica TaxID=29780 RepID=UPI001CFAF261|nr:receptor-like protein kinase FERONIA [Mangifera indica]